MDKPTEEECDSCTEWLSPDDLELYDPGDTNGKLQRWCGSCVGRHEDEQHQKAQERHEVSKELRRAVRGETPAVRLLLKELEDLRDRVKNLEMMQ